MKKLITLLVVAVMLMGCVSISFAAENKLVDEMTEYPIIFVPGFATSNLYYYDENGDYINSSSNTSPEYSDNNQDNNFGNNN